MKIMLIDPVQPKVHRGWGNDTVVAAVARSLRLGGFEVCVAQVNYVSDLLHHLNLQMPDMAFVNGYRLFGDPGQPYIHQILDEKAIPYVGSPADTLSFLERKSTMKAKLAEYNLPTPPYRVFSGETLDKELEEVTYPAVAKLDYGCESLGLHKVANARDLKCVISDLWDQYQQPVLVETWCREREYTVAVIGNNGTRKIMPVEVVLPPGYEMLTSQVKNTHLRKTVRKIDGEKSGKLIALIDETCTHLQIQDWTRIEVLEWNDGLFIIDINSTVGLKFEEAHPSYFPICTHLYLGIDYEQTINALMYECLVRCRLPVPVQLLKILDKYPVDLRTSSSFSDFFPPWV